MLEAITFTTFSTDAAGPCYLGSLPMHQMLRICDVDGCSGLEISRILTILDQECGLKFVVADGLGRVNGRLIESPNSCELLETRSLAVETSCLVQVVWAYLFLFEIAKRMEQWLPTLTLKEQIRLCDCFVQIADNTYFFVVTGDQKIVAAIQRAYAQCEVVQVGEVAALKYMY